MAPKEHNVIKQYKMKKILTIYFLVIIVCKSYAQNKEIIESEFRAKMTKDLINKLNLINLGSKKISIIQYYRFKIINKDSIIFEALNNPKLKNIDSIMNLSFEFAANNIKENGKLDSLINSAFTYIPLIILYKNEESEKLNERISIAPIESIFSFGINDETHQPEVIFRVLSPIIYRSSSQRKNYYLK